MSFPLKLLLAVAVWLAFYLITWQGCQEELCYACGPAPATTSLADTTAAASELPLYFKWSDPEAYVGDGIESLIRRTRNAGDSTQFLEITGLYFEGESQPEGAENLGLARAAEVARLFDGQLDSNRITLRARSVEAPEDAREGPFEGALFEWVDQEVSETVDDLGDRIAVRFPLGSTEKVYDPDVDAYLERLAGRIQETGERVELTGHTDNIGSSEDNIELGRARAQAIKQILTDAGVPAEQISTDTKGESMPVASNATENGRYENRRVEIRLIKQNNPQND